jgi:hypothetical protein
MGCRGFILNRLGLVGEIPESHAQIFHPPPLSPLRLMPAAVKTPQVPCPPCRCGWAMEWNWLPANVEPIDRCSPACRRSTRPHGQSCFNTNVNVG